MKNMRILRVIDDKTHLILKKINENQIFLIGQRLPLVIDRGFDSTIVHALAISWEE